jgi:hypothetical protein
MASNSTTIQDPTGSYPDWVEIFNTTNNPLSLSGLYLSDNLSINTKWAFPVTASIAANSYIIVWLDGDTLQNGYHANFKLSAGGDQLYLNYANNTMLDSVNFGQQLTDVSTGRCLNGIGTFIVQSSPTPGASNHCPTGLQHYESSNLYTLIPNPSSNLVRIMSDKKIEQIHVVNSIGQSFYNSKGGNIDFTVKNWPTGIYYVTINNQQVIKLLVD